MRRENTLRRALVRTSESPKDRAGRVMLRKLGAELELAALRLGRSAAEIARQSDLPISTVYAAFAGEDLLLDQWVAIGLALDLRLNIAMGPET